MMGATSAALAAAAFLTLVLGVALSRDSSSSTNETLSGAFGCISIITSLSGIVLAIVALCTQKDRIHVFTYIGLIGNSVILVILLLGFLVGMASESSRRRYYYRY
jgi:hypothetical protein